MCQIIAKLTVLLMLLIAGVATAGQGIWQDVSPQSLDVSNTTGLFQADDGALRTRLTLAPHESTGNWSHQIELPTPDGEVIVFNVVESPVVAAGLAAKYPEIKTYKVRGIDDPHASGRIGITPLGLYGMIHTSAGVIYLDPEEPLAQVPVYRSRFKGKMPLEEFSCGVHDAQHPVGESVNLGTRTASRMPGNLLEYDLAVAATFEYYQFFGSSIVNTMSAITMTIMRVNTIYERDLGVTLKLVADNDDIIETDVNGPLNNENTEILLKQTEDWIDSNLPGGDAAYDIGHMFSVPRFVGGGLAFLGVVCDNDLKANGVTGFPNPAAGDPYDIDFVAHEIGHQLMPIIVLTALPTVAAPAVTTQRRSSPVAGQPSWLMPESVGWKTYSLTVTRLFMPAASRKSIALPGVKETVLIQWLFWWEVPRPVIATRP